MDILKQTSTTRENLGFLAVLEALEDQERITQRELADVTGLNLKKVNYCLNQLLEQGFVKFQRVRKNPDKRAYLYILTPDGIKAKSQLTYRFLKFTLDFYNKMEKTIKRCLDEMRKSGVERIALFGASEVAKILLSLLKSEHLTVECVLDGNFKGLEFHGVPVLKEDDVKELCVDAVLITSLDTNDKLEDQLRSFGVEDELVWRLP
ncbi:MAG: MarR family EPS-associated transcriptional regulator [Gemmatimonadetes bacterium]|nr:MarR family EPS-associated transcriptional regulator [Gemmatimonadota bacterium]|tara:strand:+ start:12172 stop:12789 length:618 start_codon:yes stop_codon:yes gene_type:complete